MDNTLELLRTQIKKLRKERDEAILEKGLSAQYNQDLRENAQYDYWVDRELYLTFKIRGLLNEINSYSKKNQKKKSTTNNKARVNKPDKSKVLHQKHKWL